MRILFVTPYVPSRIRVRPFHLIRMLAREHEISLVALVCDEYERALVAEIAEYCRSVELVGLPRWQSYLHCLGAVPTRTPLRVAYYRSAAFAQRICQIIRKQCIEVVHGELIKTVPALQQVVKQTGIPVLYDAVDCISSYLTQQHATTRNLLKRAFIQTELRKMWRYELRMLSRFALVTITAEHDRQCLIKMGVARECVHVVPNGVDTAYFAPSGEAREADFLVFCAKMDYYPNVQGIVTFCQTILPRIWQHRPQVRLTIVGNNPPPVVWALSADERITITGYVPDIRSYLGKASVALAPLWVAAGMQNKVLEALAMATPLVATPAACRALSVQHGVHLLIAEEADAFADAILTLLTDQQQAQRLGMAGRQYVEEVYSWESAGHTLISLYQSLLCEMRQHDASVQQLGKTDAVMRGV
jgi:sugar transferase (PEP-CTERM/EpsH1 system associated)